MLDYFFFKEKLLRTIGKMLMNVEEDIQSLTAKCITCMNLIVVESKKPVRYLFFTIEQRATAEILSEFRKIEDKLQHEISHQCVFMTY